MTHTAVHIKIWFILFCFPAIFSYGQDNKFLPEASGKNTIPYDTIWVDSIFNSLSLDEKIAQLFIVRANNPGGEYFTEVETLIKKYNIGGITFFRSEPSKQLMQTIQWQKLAKTPLFVSIDAEWGLGMRLDSTISFPYQMTLGAIQDDSLIYEMGKEIGRQCRLMGIHINFAPVFDINNNPSNPVINVRSFGENRHQVAAKGIAYANGLKSENIIATGKHFPGHGDTDTDSHKSLPVITHTRTRLDSVELFPFAESINQGLDAIMIAHLYIPAYEKKENTATTLSFNVVTTLLKDSLGFKGLIVTDALDMKGVTKYFDEGEIELKAMLAGNDILLLPANVPVAIKTIKEAIDMGTLTTGYIDQKCRKVLEYKSRAGLDQLQDFQKGHLLSSLNTPKALWLNEELYKQSVTLVKNNNSLVPLKELDTLKIAALAIGASQYCQFHDYLGFYGPVDCFGIGTSPNEKETATLVKTLQPYNLVIVSINNTNIYAGKNFGISENAIDFVEKLAKEKKIILDIFGNPYSLAFFDSTSNMEAIIISYQDNKVSQAVSAQAIFGGFGIRGRLPVTASREYQAGTGIDTEKYRLEYTLPAEFGITNEEIGKIDSIAFSGVLKKAYPGCQVMAAKNGKIFYHKAFGTLTYTDSDTVLPSHIYDLASLTKIMATTLAIMKLQEDGRIDIDKPVSEYLPFLRNTPKGRIILRDLMAHQAGLKAWIPYYRFTLNDNGHPDSTTYSTKISEDFPVRVAENFYIRDNYNYHIFDSIIYSAPLEENSYKYSDLGFILLARIIENTTNKPFDSYLEEVFYKPLGMNYTGFEPRKRFGLKQIAPTEDDQLFRKQLLRGDVHDPAAAMLGGVSGHAGLFSNAGDVAKFLYMLLQSGNYGGTKYLEGNTVYEYTRVQFPLNLNRRGIGFDKPSLEQSENGNACKNASPASYGHSGFTGTYCWADPENQLIYVFLCNRIHPDAGNTMLQKLNIRTNLHQAIYDALNNTGNN